MPILSAFADEISPDLDVQIRVLKECGLSHFDIRGVWDTGIMELSDAQLGEIKGKIDGQGIKIAAVGSPIGKSTIDKPASYELDRVKRAYDIANLFGSRYIRVFSYYAPERESIADYRDEVIERMKSWVDWITSQRNTVVLVHENESDIYGDIPERCLDLMQNLYSPQFVQCYDPANWVNVGMKHVFETCWKPLKEYVKFVHLKDYTGNRNVPCGEGDGEVAKTLEDACRSGFDGFMTIEPHLAKAGQYQGFSGPELFKKAVDSVRDICNRSGIPLSQ